MLCSFTKNIKNMLESIKRTILIECNNVVL